jgi:hypothetical protein
MTNDEKRLLKHGLFGAVLISGFWLLVSTIRSHIVTVIALVLWFAFFFWVFYRDPHSEKSN